MSKEHISEKLKEMVDQMRQAQGVNDLVSTEWTVRVIKENSESLIKENNYKDSKPK